MEQPELLPFRLGQHLLTIQVAEVVRVLPALVWSELPYCLLSVDAIIHGKDIVLELYG